ncbi:DNA primase [Salinisphaera sp. PC39]|uniref:DNA primase n=1 Tax=Salinisphaera sp. PC39 TaxID=1304156 RepID=UPI0033414B0C
MARIPQAFLDELLSRTDIVALIEARLPLRKAGREFQALCPFHDEKSPSFTVSPAKQFYHCFGCGAHGTAISFLMEYDRLEFRETVEVLASQAGMEIPEDARAGPDPDRQKPLFDALATADRHYRQWLRRSREAVDYLKGRGISGEIAKTYGLGFAPPGWDNLGARVDRRAAIEAGLLIERDGRSYDRFRNRVMFPIRDGRGRTIGFGGRTLGDDKAKYLNSPETPLFHKGRHVYGLYEARQLLREIPRMLVVEGYMDVIALAQHGFPNAVATLGTATTPEHLQALFRVTGEVVFCFDGDAAGRRAAWRALEQALPVLRGTRRIRFLFLPEGEDPDSLVRGPAGPEGFRALIDEARPASRVLLDGLAEGLDLHNADGRSQLIEAARPYIGKLPPEAFKAQLIREIAERSGLPANDLERLYREGGSASGPAPPAAAPTARGELRMNPVRRALQILMDRPRLADNIDGYEALRQSEVAGTGLLADAIDFFRNNPRLPAAAFLERLRDRDEHAALQKLAAQSITGDDERLAREFAGCIDRITGRARADSARARYEALLARQERQPLSADEAAELQNLLRELRAARP